MTYRFNQSAISSCIAVTLCYGRYSKVGVGVERIFQNSKGSVRRILPGCDGRAQGTNIDSQTLLQIHVEVSNLARVSVQAEAESTRKQLWRTGHARLSSWRSEAHSSISFPGRWLNFTILWIDSSNWIDSFKTVTISCHVPDTC